MSDLIISLPTTVQAVKRSQRGPDEHGITQILEQEVELTLEEFFGPSLTFVATNYGVMTDNNSSTIDWGLKNIQKATLVANTAFIFKAPGGSTHLTFEIVQGASGGYTMTWPTTVDWTEGVAPGAGAAGKTIIITFVYNGSRYRGQFTSYFS